MLLKKSLEVQNQFLTPLPKRLIINNVEVLEKKKIAEHFNKYFVNVGQNLASTIPTSQKKKLKIFLLKTILH